MQISKYFTHKLVQYSGYPSILIERDACGVGFIAQINQLPSHNLVIKAINALSCMEHRGGCSADRISGDGAGITTQIPWNLLKSSFASQQIQFYNDVAVAMVFLPSEHIQAIRKIFVWALEEEGLNVLNWRNVPRNDSVLGTQAKLNQPEIQQCFVQAKDVTGDALERLLYLTRKKIEKLIAQTNLNLNKQFYFCSFSSKMIVYKGMVKSKILAQYYLDLSDSRYESNFAIYHRRFSTNTLPKWPLAQPMRFMAHNGEINTLLGNLNWMKSKESLLKHSYWNNNHDILIPVTSSENSDSANLDAVLELFIQSGKSPQEALMILIPEAYQDQPALDQFPEIIDFYEYYKPLQEPWDGPALVVFSDGKIVGATLDRNGLRPARYLITQDGFISLSSEVGVFDIDSKSIVQKGRLGPGQIFCVDLVNNLILDNWTIKQFIANKFPYKKWIQKYQKVLIPEHYLNDEGINKLQMNKLHTAFGYTNEDIELVIEHMASSAKEPTFCMGDDIPLAVLSEKPHLIYDYFKQRFAQVTNPAIDPLRESLVMSLNMHLGSKGNLLEPQDYMAKSILLDSPILNERELKQLFNHGFKITVINTFFNQDVEFQNFHVKIQDICKKSVHSINNGAEIIVLSDKVQNLSDQEAFIPPLLIIGAVHHYLISKHLRHKVSLVVETAQCWNTHHFACLIGYGASAICPYAAFLTVRQWWNSPRTQKLMSKEKLDSLTIQQSQNNYRVAINKGLLKILSKMGISLLSSYHGAQIFEILGLGKELVNMAFLGTTSRLDGITLNELAMQTIKIYNTAFLSSLPKKLPNLGYVQYRPSAEYHVNNPEMSKTLHKAVRNNDHLLYTKYKNLLNNRPPTNLRDLLTVSSNLPSIHINEVEPIESILECFCTGGMSLGALSRETHETLAVAMNRIGGKSNSGEGGEDASRFGLIQDVDIAGISKSFSHLKGLKLNDTASSAIKQVASGRFGVTPEYLVNAKQLEIKIAQGAKPGEGGQLPGKKVSPYIAQLRNCKPGVTLISPPPHHDIYSIEDLAQLIFDLHQINPIAKVSVKLVAEIGIGTIAAGVAKGNADIIQISGHDGGTGASPLSSIKHAGSPWELGLTEVHQTLVENNLRDRVLLRVDGGLRTGHDIILAALMGAQEFGFGTVAMIATGCVMARICHTNNCPVGVATQRQDLRNRYPGIPSDLVNFFLFIAEEVRQILATLGYKSLQEIVGLSKLLKYKSTVLSKTKYLNLDTLLFNPVAIDVIEKHDFVHSNGTVLDDILLSDPDFKNAIQFQSDITKTVQIVNTDRCVGARISGVIAKKYGNYGFNGNLQLDFQGVAGQSFGAFISKGIHLSLIGEANDYVGKGMNGGEIIICPSQYENNHASEKVILGNTCLYGATGGYLFASGQAGERFAVRNSSGQAVVEGVGDHPCEYMTGGLIVVLGPSGRNIGAGMTGGLAYFLDEDNTLVSKINQEIVKYQHIVTKEGEEQLKNMIELYEIKTKSIKAKHILDNWNKYLDMFWQIVPPSENSTPLTDFKYSIFNTVSN
ncbi:ferredoxin-dependent glutamate synthase (plastid) [Chondrus crispus]|uniref:Ferredoxin-dependent glutamate synthase n=1 Tax=Chondrus crispus TaxID=2769 RepID=M5DET9_CHOCR|nr:ferredoxin-dependent glutamate synthase [Chondrus crispus]CCP38221.1 ferredoxin-dependent glutamate synthase [Chondrus crispus]|eukprot:YP_007627474.1 ferredoxin-dependent glutamate synthase (plastid) [Chondrus crispus]